MARITIDGILYDVADLEAEALAQQIAGALSGGETCTLAASRFGGPRPVEGRLVIAPGQSFFITG
ncbi:hypothetical protein SCMU_28600 [Sinomonas cyclohexanicum]|uniref:Uncharacterized protein n=1 Tax=Sinomonas cyclohexanicum TaxID=322009 RepID=A0ABN6FMF5_SINCY|nr:hypothetical protein [Corynebacterium cyclohexanicum]BCT77018.1 hypothetical protein SCMU_28600 [Corynebacterium cyclohexanicum]